MTTLVSIKWRAIALFRAAEPLSVKVFGMSSKVRTYILLSVLPMYVLWDVHINPWY